MYASRKQSRVISESSGTVGIQAHPYVHILTPAFDEAGNALKHLGQPVRSGRCTTAFERPLDLAFSAAFRPREAEVIHMPDSSGCEMRFCGLSSAFKGDLIFMQGAERILLESNRAGFRHVFSQRQQPILSGMFLSAQYAEGGINKFRGPIGLDIMWFGVLPC
jgi:hypothetical protein